MARVAGAIAVVATIANLAGIAPPSIEVAPTPALIDQPLSAFSVTGLTPRQRITIAASAADALKREWRSEATFEASAGGVVDLTQQRPLSGSYDSVDGMGLLWSMARVDRVPGGLFARGQLPAYTVRLEVTADGRTLATTDVVRQFYSPRITQRDVNDNGLIGRIWTPGVAGPHPAVLLLTGGSGGIQMRFGPLLASHGFTVFSLGYFGIAPAPPKLIEIPLEYFERAATWLQRQSDVDPNRIGVVGASKGGEAALLIAATFPMFKAVVAYAASSVVWEGAMIERDGVVIDPKPNRSSWSYRGVPLDYLPKQASPEATRVVVENSAHSRALYEPALADAAGIARAAIPVERINGAVLLLSGRDDVAWPSTRMSDMVIDRLRRAHHRFPFEHLAFPNAGHVVEDGYLPTTGFSSIQGGTAAGNARAQAESAAAVIRFLDANLARRQ